MKKVLLTGSSGFVGSSLVRLIGDEFQFLPIPRQAIDIDCCLEEDAIGVIHLAGKAHDTKKSTSFSEYEKSNFELTKLIYNAFLNSSAKFFIYFSSVKAAADIVEGVLTEEIEACPSTDYGRTKLMAETYIMENYPSNKKVFVFRPCMIHGAGNKGNLPLFFNIIRKGIPFPFGCFDNKRSFLSIDNVAIITREFLNNFDNIPSGIYNLADDEPVSLKDLALLIGEIINVKVRIFNVPKSIVFFLAKIGDRIPFILNSERLQKMTESYVVSNQKLKSVLSENVSLLHAKRGLEETIIKFKK